jgi:hypothetical protein
MRPREKEARYAGASHRGRAAPNRVKRKIAGVRAAESSARHHQRPASDIAESHELRGAGHADRLGGEYKRCRCQIRRRRRDSCARQIDGPGHSRHACRCALNCQGGRTESYSTGRGSKRRGKGHHEIAGSTRRNGSAARVSFGEIRQVRAASRHSEHQGRVPDILHKHEAGRAGRADGLPSKLNGGRGDGS